MAYANIREDFLACSQLMMPSRLPTFALGLGFDYHRAGLTYHDTRTNVSGMVRSQVAAVREYDYDWAIIVDVFLAIGVPHATAITARDESRV